MTFGELLAEVYTLTNRSDLVAETKVAVKSATLKAHQSDFYSKDLSEVYINLGTTDAYVWSFDVITHVSNFRAIKYIRKYDPDTSEPGDFISIILPEEVLDSYKVTRKDVAYVAGRNIEIKSSTEFSKMIFASYVNPIITESGYSSWVADLYPYAIVYEATRIVFKTIGFDEQAAQYEKLANDQLQILKTNAISDVGY